MLVNFAHGPLVVCRLHVLPYRVPTTYARCGPTERDADSGQGGLFILHRLSRLTFRSPPFFWLTPRRRVLDNIHHCSSAFIHPSIGIHIYGLIWMHVRCRLHIAGHRSPIWHLAPAVTSVVSVRSVVSVARYGSLWCRWLATGPRGVGGSLRVPMVSVARYGSLWCRWLATGPRGVGGSLRVLVVSVARYGSLWCRWLATGP